MQPKPKTLIRTYKYRLFPDPLRERRLRSTLDACRLTYNLMLSTWREDTRITKLDLINRLPGWKSEYPWMLSVHSQVLQQVASRVDQARAGYEAGRTKKWPEPKNEVSSFTFPQSGYQLDTDDQTLSLFKIGVVGVRLHRPLGGVVKQLTIIRQLGKWYALFALEVPGKELPGTGQAVGLDLGLTWFATLSNGGRIDNPRFLQKQEKTLAELETQLQHQYTEDLVHRIRRVHQKVMNQRTDYFHKISLMLLRKYDFIAAEDLSVARMAGSLQPRNRRYLYDVSWMQFLGILQAKAEEYGKEVVLVNPWNTSKECSGCGTLVSKPLSQRRHKCPTCGLDIDRDKNAAINILARAKNLASTKE